jgi:hypothetical protein
MGWLFNKQKHVDLHKQDTELPPFISEIWRSKVLVNLYGNVKMIQKLIGVNTDYIGQITKVGDTIIFPVLDCCTELAMVDKACNYLYKLEYSSAQFVQTLPSEMNQWTKYISDNIADYLLERHKGVWSKFAAQVIDAVPVTIHSVEGVSFSVVYHLTENPLSRVKRKGLKG